jgi:hypothetical protein
MEPTEEWLNTINEEFRKADIHPRQRPFRAIEAFSRKFNCSVFIPSNTADKIFEWFKKNTPEGSQVIGALFRGVYYFDSVFWPVYIPIVYGQVQINVFSSLETMPEHFKRQIEADKMELWNYVLLWVDCLDYAYGYGKLIHDSRFIGHAGNFIRSGNKELTAAVAMLLQNRPETKAIESCRMAVEMFLKSIIIAKSGWSEEQIKRRISHDLNKAAREVITVTNNDEFKKLGPEYSFFPEIDERYSGRDWKPIDLWRGYCLAQTTATIFTRLYSDRDTRNQFVK